MSIDRAATMGEAGTGASSRRALATVIGIVFIDLLGFGIVIPILPFYVRSFGVSDVYIGLLAAAYSLMQFLFAPLLGRLSDERGRRPVLMLSVLGNAVAWTFFGLGAQFELAFGTAGGLGILFASRMLAGAMGGNVATAQAYVADVTDPTDRAGALGLVGAAFGLGFVFGPAIGALFASDAVVGWAAGTFPAFVPATRFSLPSFAAAGFSLLAFVATYVTLSEPTRRRSAAVGRVGIVGPFRDALADVDLRPLVVVFLVASVAFSGVQVVFVPFVADVFGYDETQAGFLLTYVGILGVINQGFVVRKLSRRFADALLSLGGAVLLLVALATLPFSEPIGDLLPAAISLFGEGPGLVVLLVVLAILSTGNGLLNVGIATQVSSAAGEDRQGSAFGVTQGAGSLGRTVGPPIMTALYVVAVPGPFVLGAALTVLVVVVLAAVARRGLPDVLDRPA
jgi:MFS family permease